MMKISDLQSQIALNRNISRDLEESMHLQKVAIHHILRFNGLIKLDSDAQERLYDRRMTVSYLKKKIKQYAKLQRALKSELAYRIQCNRVTREVEAMTQKAKQEGWEVLVVDDDTYNQMLKGE